MAAVTSPYYRETRPYYGRSLADQHSLANRQAAVQTLSALCNEYVEAENSTAALRDDGEVEVKGDDLFDRIDVYRAGRLHPGDLSHWLRTEVAFNITQDQMTVVHAFLDNGGHYYIDRDAFIKAVSKAKEESEDDAPIVEEAPANDGTQQVAE